MHYEEYLTRKAQLEFEINKVNKVLKSDNEYSSPEAKESFQAWAQQASRKAHDALNELEAQYWGNYREMVYRGRAY